MAVNTEPKPVSVSDKGKEPARLLCHMYLTDKDNNDDKVSITSEASNNNSPPPSGTEEELGLLSVYISETQLHSISIKTHQLFKSKQTQTHMLRHKAHPLEYIQHKAVQ